MIVTNPLKLLQLIVTKNQLRMMKFFTYYNCTTPADRNISRDKVLRRHIHVASANTHPSAWVISHPEPVAQSARRNRSPPRLISKSKI